VRHEPQHEINSTVKLLGFLRHPNLRAEAGIVVDITDNFGLTVSARRIYNLYDQHEDIIMLGIVFR